MSAGDERWMRHALEMAELGLERGEMPIGAVVVVDDEVVGEAHTEERTQRRLLVHADLLALDRADGRLAGRRARATLYVNLEPCVMCLGAAFTTRVGAVVYGLESPSDGGVETFANWDRTRAAAGLPTYQAPEVRGGVLRTEAAALFARYASDDEVPAWARRWASELAASGSTEIR
jgi:tRNA(adenine34) deaminase